MTTAAFADQLAAYGPDAARTLAPSLAESSDYCRRLAATHYENFSVATRLLPRALRPHFCHVYAYCRWADDLADEIHGSDESLRLLDWWEGELDACIAGQPTHPVFVALNGTIREFGIPAGPFRDLLSAFRQDQTVSRYETWDDLLAYCRRSANPVGRIVLYLARSFNERRAALADSVCTGLQIANFCQDVARDWDRGRIYFPQADCRRAGYGDADFAAHRFNDAFRQLMDWQLDRAETLLAKGLPLFEQMPRGLRGDVWLFIQGGLAICRRIRAVNCNVWRRRPELSKLDKLRLVAGCIVRGVAFGGGSS